MKKLIYFLGFSLVVILIFAYKGDIQINSLFSTNSSTQWKEYSDDEHGFSFEYPSEWIVNGAWPFIQISNGPLVTDAGDVFSISFGSDVKSEDSSDWDGGGVGVISNQKFFSKRVEMEDKSVSIGMSASDTQTMKIQDKILESLVFVD